MIWYRLTTRYYVDGKPSISWKEFDDPWWREYKFEPTHNGTRETEWFPNRAALDARIAEIREDTKDW